jgi:NADH:ubiquinone oxidoreductase subunit 3 (subunit A)
MTVLLAPPFAFIAYLVVAGALLGIGKVVAGRRRARASEKMPYASGERASGLHARPGYQPYFGVALFFALLHVGVLVASTGGFTPLSLVYMGGLLLVLLVVAVG